MTPLSYSSSFVHPRQTLIYFLPLQIKLHFLEFYIDRILQYILLLVWIFSFIIIILRFTHAVTNINHLFLFTSESHSSVWIYYNFFIFSSIGWPLYYFHFEAVAHKPPKIIHIYIVEWAYISLLIGKTYKQVSQDRCVHITFQQPAQLFGKGLNTTNRL